MIPEKSLSDAKTGTAGYIVTLAVKSVTLLLLMTTLFARNAAAESKYEVCKSSSATSSQTNFVFIGDSRTLQMYRSIGTEESSRSSWSAKSAMGYTWMVSTGIPQAEKFMSPGSCAVICMGTNDINTGAGIRYPACINRKAAEWAKLGIRTYFVSVNPIEDAKKEQSGSDKRNWQVIAFNQMMKNGLSENVTYIDTYSSLAGDFTTVDGTHYPAEINRKVYRLIKHFIVEDSKSRKVRIIFHRNISESDTVKASKAFYSGLCYPAATVSWKRKGYALAGWAFSSGAEVPEIPYEEMLPELEQGTVHLYAVWKKTPLSCQVRFMRNYNSRDKTYRTQTFTEGMGQRISKKGWEREGYILTGWSSGRSAAKRGYALYNKFSDVWIRQHSDGFTLYAVWKKRMR